jgi:O-antigen/teichoic acid export membrane protein
VVGTLFGEKYVAVSPLLGWFALAAALYSLASLMMQYLLSLHETTVVYSLVALASLEIVSLFFFGATLYAIIGITIVTQIIALIIGVGFVVKSHRYVPIDLDRRPGL